MHVQGQSPTAHVNAAAISNVIPAAAPNADKETENPSIEAQYKGKWSHIVYSASELARARAHIPPDLMANILRGDQVMPRKYLDSFKNHNPPAAQSPVMSDTHDSPEGSPARSSDLEVLEGLPSQGSPPALVSGLLPTPDVVPANGQSPEPGTQGLLRRLLYV